MNAHCPEFEPLVLDRAAGMLDPDGEARLDAHLAGCAGCRSRAGDVDRALALAALPPPSGEEQAAVRDGARETLARMHRERRDRRWASAGALLAIAAGVAVAIGVPQLVRSPGPDAAGPVAGGGAGAAATAAEAADGWKLPDLDAAWAAAVSASPDADADGGSDDGAEPLVLYAELQEVNFDPE